MTILLLLTYCISSGQNFVNNPSFEDTVHCPELQNEINFATGWENFGGSPDYFNSCSPNWTQFTVPNNWGGYQVPATGNAYCAIGTYAPGFPVPDIREFIGTQLISPLTVGTKYYVSFKICLSIAPAIVAYIATNKMGAKFSMSSYTFSAPPLTDNFAHVYSNLIVTDTANWTSISGSFIADSAYQYLMLGNFFDDINTDTIVFKDTTFNFAYYYIDDICVSTDSLTCYTPVGIQEPKQNNDISLFPNPFTNQLTFQLSSKELNEIILYDLSSRKLLKQTFTNTTTINTEQFAKGMYLYTVRNRKGIIKNGKVIKE